MNKNETQIIPRRVNDYVFARLIDGKAATIIENECGEWEPEPDERFEPYRKVISGSYAVNLAKEGTRCCVENKLHIIMPGYTCIFDDESLAAFA